MKTQMSKEDALIEIIREAMGSTATKSGYKRSLRACTALDLPPEMRTRVLHELAYCQKDGTLYDWLTKKRQEKPF